jgi:hypothetical protein
MQVKIFFFHETIKSPENGKMTALAVHARQENAGKREN